MLSRSASVRSLSLLIALVAITASCSDDGDEATSETATTVDAGAVESETEGAGGRTAICLTSGCNVVVDSVTPVDGELQLELSANFDLDSSGTHIHIYWDLYTGAQVSADAEARGLTPGRWDEAVSSPYTTAGLASVGRRGESSTLCAVAATADHVVIEPDAVTCIDVSAQL